MSRPRDLYGEAHGPRREAVDRDEAVICALSVLKYRDPSRRYWTEASTGHMLTVWRSTPRGPECVGSAWESSKRTWYWRLKP